MDYTARRVALVKQRVRENTRRRQRRGIYGLSAACMLLFTVLMQAAGTVIGPGQTAAWGSFGAMLLREDAGGYGLAAGAGTLQKRRMQHTERVYCKGNSVLLRLFTERVRWRLSAEDPW